MSSVDTDEKLPSSKRRFERWKFPKVEDLPPPSLERTAIIQFVAPSGELTGPEVSLNLSVTKNDLEGLLNGLLVEGDALRPDKSTPYSLTIAEGTVEVIDSLAAAFDASGLSSREASIRVKFFPLSPLRVRSVSRQSASLTGHAGPILALDFSPDGTQLATGSGDATLRFWDLNTHMPKFTCKGHSSHVMYVKWSPREDVVASADERGGVCIWDPKTGQQRGEFRRGHTKAVAAVAWEPLHLLKSDDAEPRLATASKDATIRIWLARGEGCTTLGGHSAMVTSVCWSGEPSGRLYSASRDRSIRVWDTDAGHCLQTVTEHGHWLNHLALNTALVMRTGAQGLGGVEGDSAVGRRERAKKRYDEFMSRNGNIERLVSCSDDFTLSLWTPPHSTPKRLTGHQQPVNMVCFSPDGRMFASASFDKSIKLWESATGSFIATLRGHVGRVYMLDWSPDSRMIASASSDSLIKMWDIQTRKWKHDLPGHADEVWALQWSADGGCVASGGRDKVVKIWRN